MNLLYPGSFDPITYGHLDIIDRASRISEKLYVAIMINQSKKPMFTLEERVALIESSTKHLPNVEIIKFEGLLVSLFDQYDIQAVVRGLRAVSDFDIEFQMAQINRQMKEQAETLFMMTRLEYSYLSSSIVKELFSLGAAIDGLVPPEVIKAMKKKETK